MNKRKKNEHNIIFESINKYHPKTSVTIKVNPSKFVDTKIINNKDNNTTEAFRKGCKLSVHWSSNVNAAIRNLHRSKRTSSNFQREIRILTCEMLTVHQHFQTVSEISSLLLKITIGLLFHLIFLKKVKHLFG